MTRLVSLKTRNDFASVFNSGKKKLGPFVVYTSNSINTCSREKLNNRQKKFGILIPKKNVKLSVNRNLIRRWVKELLRASKIEADYIVLVDHPISAESKREKSLLLDNLKKLISSVSDDVK